MEKTEFDVFKQNILANLCRIEQLLNKEDIDKKSVALEDWLNDVNKDNVELRQRLKLLRKETLHLEKEMV